MKRWARSTRWEIRKTLVDTAKEYHDKLVERSPNRTIICSPSTSKAIHHRRGAPRRDRKATSRRRFSVVSDGLQEQRRAESSDAVVDYLPRARCSPHGRNRGPIIPKRRSSAVPTTPSRCRPRLQNHDRPVCRQLAFIRVYSGAPGGGESIYNVAKGRKERVGRLVKMHANKREEITEILAGDICAAVGLKTSLTATPSRRKAPDSARVDRLPAPVIQLAIRTQNKQDQESWHAIAKLVQEDPTLKVSTDPDTARRFSRWACCILKSSSTHAARVQRRRKRRQAAGAYRETVRQTAEADLHAQEADRRMGQYARVKLQSSRCRGQRFRIETTFRRRDSQGIYSGD